MKRIKSLLLFGLLAIPFTFVEAAGSASISVNGTVVNGDKVTATVTLSNVASWDVKVKGTGSTEGCSAHEADASNNGQNTTKKIVVTCKANSLGTITFSFSGDVTSSDGTNIPVSGSKKVTVVKPREKSTNNNLKGLSVEGYEITPAFNKDTLEYTVNLDSNVESIKINATKEDGYASVSGAGDKEVALGDNKFEIKVTSETGKEKVYVLNVIVNDNNPITKSYDGKDYSVVKRKSSLTVPNNELFTETSIKIEEFDIPAFTSETLGMILIGMKDSNNIIYLFKVDESGNILGKYETLEGSSQTVLFKDTKEEIDGYTKGLITIDEKEYSVYKNSNEKVVLIYGTNLKTNEDNWYSYNTIDKSLQLFDKDGYEANKNLLSENDKKLEQYKLVIYGLSGLSILLLIITVVAILSKGKKKTKKVVAVEPVKKEENIKKVEKVEEPKEEVISKKIEKEEVKSENKEEKSTKKKSKKKEKVEETKEVVTDEVKDDAIPSFEEIEKDLLDVVTNMNDEDELVSADDFLDLKKKKKRK